MLKGIILAFLHVFILIWTIGFLFVFRKRISVMIGMAAAMCIGMVIGFGTGILTAILLPSQFASAALIGTAIGMAAGAAAGCMIGLAAVLDGILAGAMAGMMGAMLVAMLPSSQQQDVLFFSIVISGLIQFVLTLVLQENAETHHARAPQRLFRSPALPFCIIAAAAVLAISVSR